MIDLYEATVFANADGEYGDKHGIIIDEAGTLNASARLTIAANLGYAETIFINDSKSSDISFFAQTKEIPFAGTAALAAAGFLENMNGSYLVHLNSQGKTIPVTHEDGIIRIEANISIMPDWNFIQASSVSELEGYTTEITSTLEHTMVWAWEDESRGLIRARTFAADWLLPEVEANGSGSMRLAHTLRKDICVVHGSGSEIFAKPMVGNMASLGGVVTASSVPIRSISF